MSPLVLLVDAKCGPCSALGKEVVARSGGRLEVAGLDDPGWRGLVRPDEPVIIERATGRQWRRLRLLFKLAAIVGPGEALALLRWAGRSGATPGSPRAWGGSLLGGLAAVAAVAVGSRPRGVSGAPRPRSGG